MHALAIIAKTKKKQEAAERIRAVNKKKRYEKAVANNNASSQDIKVDTAEARQSISNDTSTAPLQSRNASIEINTSNSVNPSLVSSPFLETSSLDNSELRDASSVVTHSSYVNTSLLPTRPFRTSSRELNNTNFF
jgi:hypothetical protein